MSDISFPKRTGSSLHTEMTRKVDSLSCASSSTEQLPQEAGEEKIKTELEETPFLMFSKNSMCDR